MSSHQKGLEDLEAPKEPAASGISIEDEHFAQIQSPEAPNKLPNPTNLDLPPHIAMPLSSIRSTSSGGRVLREGPTTSIDEDNVSVRSFVPTLSARDDLETMLTEMLGSDGRWRIEDDDDFELWEDRSQGDSSPDIGSIDDLEDEGSNTDGILAKC